MSFLYGSTDLTSKEWAITSLVSQGHTNAQIAAARADYFPQITLTASGGFQSPALSQLFTGPAGMWSFAGQLLQPIFTGGKIRSNVRLTEAQKQEDKKY